MENENKTKEIKITSSEREQFLTPIHCPVCGQLAAGNELVYALNGHSVALEHTTGRKHPVCWTCARNKLGYLTQKEGKPEPTPETPNINSKGAIFSGGIRLGGKK